MTSLQKIRTQLLRNDILAEKMGRGYFMLHFNFGAFAANVYQQDELSRRQKSWES
jgi:diacylglycerol kinase family enzyme